MKAVRIKVDLERREELRRLHTATHILNHCAREVLGKHVWQNGSNLKPEQGSLDITHYELPSQQELQEIEKKVNEVIFANKKVQIEELERSKAEEKYGFSLYQGGAIPLKTLRIIHVHENDIEACGGIHMDETGGIGFFKLLDVQKIQDGVIRLSYAVHSYALQNLAEEQKVLRELENTFKVEKKLLPKTAEKFFTEWKEQKKTIERLEEELEEVYAQQISESKEKEIVLKKDYDMKFMINVFNTALKKKQTLKISSKRFTLATQDMKVEAVAKAIPKGKFTLYIHKNVSKK